MSEEFQKAMNNIYGFKVEHKNGQTIVKAPKMDLPEDVKYRIHYFSQMAESGLTFYGAMKLILCYEDEKEKLIEEFEMGAVKDWLEPTDEFIKWRDTHPFGTQEMQIAVAMIYGPEKELEE